MGSPIVSIAFTWRDQNPRCQVLKEAYKLSGPWLINSQAYQHSNLRG